MIGNNQTLKIFNYLNYCFASLGTQILLPKVKFQQSLRKSNNEPEVNKSQDYFIAMIVEDLTKESPGKIVLPL